MSQKAEAGGLSRIRGQPGLPNEIWSQKPKPTNQRNVFSKGLSRIPVSCMEGQDVRNVQPVEVPGDLPVGPGRRPPEHTGNPALTREALEENRMATASTHLCTVWEATRKDMRSPPVSCCPATREPPTNRVPRTMPVEGGQEMRKAARGRRDSPVQCALSPSPELSSTEWGSW